MLFRSAADKSQTINRSVILSESKHVGAKLYFTSIVTSCRPWTTPGS